MHGKKLTSSYKQVINPTIWVEWPYTFLNYILLKIIKLIFSLIGVHMQKKSGGSFWRLPFTLQFVFSNIYALKLKLDGNLHIYPV